MPKKNNASTLKILITILVITYLAGMGYVAYWYIQQAPKRATSNFLNSIIQKNDLASAYSEMAPTYRNNVEFSKFVGFFGGLSGSKVKYSIAEQKVSGNYAITDGYIYDYKGASYIYIFHLEKQNSKWLIDSTFDTKQ